MFTLMAGCVLAPIAIAPEYEWLVRQPVTAYLYGDRTAERHLIGRGKEIFPIAKRILRDQHAQAYYLEGLLVVLNQIEADRAEFVPLVVNLLSHHESVVRGRAAQLVGSIGSARDAPPLVVLLWDDDNVHAAIDALGNIGDERAAAALTGWLRPRTDTGPYSTERLAEQARNRILARLDAEKKAKAAPKP